MPYVRDDNPRSKDKLPSPVKYRRNDNFFSFGKSKNATKNNITITDYPSGISSVSIAKLFFFTRILILISGSFYMVILFSKI